MPLDRTPTDERHAACARLLALAAADMQDGHIARARARAASVVMSLLPDERSRRMLAALGQAADGSASDDDTLDALEELEADARAWRAEMEGEPRPADVRGERALAPVVR